MNDIAQQPEPLDEAALRRRLINRIALAGVAIVVLLGGLAVIDSMYVAPTAPAPVAEPSRQIEAVDVPSTPIAAPEPPRPEAVPTIKRAPAEPEESSSPSAPMPHHAPAKAVAAAPAQELAHQEPATVNNHAPTPRPLTQGTQAERRFVLQMGVFNNIDNAQELLAKLQNGGVPAQIEARVQVGPFKTRAEADAARAKVKAMGLDDGLLMAIHH